MVLAHELDHGLQDQTFDLHRFEDVPSSEGDAALARRALVEGDGVALMIEVMVARSHAKVDWANPEIATAIEKAMGTPGSGGEDIDKAPLAIREAMLFPYRAGFGSSRRCAAASRGARSTPRTLAAEVDRADPPPRALPRR